jgi:long-chain acyl-CoA synthetase
LALAREAFNVGLGVGMSPAHLTGVVPVAKAKKEGFTADDLALQRLYHFEKSTPDRIVFTQPMGGGVVRDMTWREVMDETRRMAAHLKAMGFEPGSKIAILSKNCAHWLMSDWAIWLAGYVSVPLYPTLAPDTIAQILKHSESKVLFVGKLDGWEGMKPGVPADLPCISYPLSPPNDYPTWNDIIKKSAPMKESPTRDADELCTLIYTSGTTGEPKGVMHTFGNFAWAVKSGLKRLPIDGSARMLSYLPLAHVAERALVEHGLLGTGMHLFFAESLETFTADLQRARPTMFFSVPRLWVKFQQGINAKMPQKKLNLLLKIPVLGGIVRKKILTALGLDQCEYAAGGAAPMPPELLTWYSKLGLNIIEVYGMTENCAVSHSTAPGRIQPGAVGKPFDGVESRLDPQTGEIQMRSPALMKGYYKQEALTREVFTEDGWLHTGDKGALDAAGDLRITGRVKDLFKTSKGKYVAPAPIEDKLVMNVAVEACAVSGANLGQPVGIAMLNADAVLKAKSAAGRAELEAALKEHLKSVNARLDPHEQLDCLALVTTPWTVDNGFITPTFKIKRNRIEEVYGPQFEAWVAKRQELIWVD